MIDSHSFGYISSTVLKTTLSGTYYAPATGLYTLDIQNSNTLSATTNLINYIDNITLKPNDWTLGSDGNNFSCLKPTTRTFTLKAGNQYANTPYWMWVGLSGTYPGMTVSGMHVPLNYDPLVMFNWINPGAIGTGFYGTLDGNGNATAQLTGITGLSWVYTNLYFAYVVLSPSGGFPIQMASNPINATFTYVE